PNIWRLRQDFGYRVLQPDNMVKTTREEDGCCTICSCELARESSRKRRSDGGR
ncbi:unnamed protein product, partial [Ascophyllum nodosum]